MLKRTISLFLTALICISLNACNQKKSTESTEDSDALSDSVYEENSPDSESVEDQTPIDLSYIRNEMLSSASSLPEMYTVDNTHSDADYSFEYLSDIDYSKVGAYFLSFAKTPVADEIAVIYLTDSSDVEATVTSIETHVEDRIALFSTYAKDEVERLNNALIFSEGNFVVLIICDDAQEVKEAFYRSITE